MAATTPTLGLYKPGGGSSGLITPDETVDIDKLNANADLIDAEALSVRNRIAPLEDQDRQYRGPAASLAGRSGMRLGDTYQETDAGKRLWYYDGTNWITNEAGLFLIRPSSVEGGTVEPDGRVKFTGGLASLTVNGVFSPRFRDYVVEFLLNSPAGSGTSLQLTAGGTVYAGATYNSQRLTSVAAATTSSATASATSWPATAISGVYLAGQWWFTHPSHVGPKFFASDVTQATGTGYGRESGWVGSVDANLYDGFRLNITGQTFNGGDTPYLKVYGRA